MTAVTHPARFHDRLLDVIAPWLEPGWLVLDPYAGSGRIHELMHVETIGVEIEDKWAMMNSRTARGDAAFLPFADATFDAIATSPAYGNRMADRSVRPTARTYSYAHALGRLPSPGSGAGLQWGAAYRALHVTHVDEMARVLRPGGRFVLNMKDHERHRERQRVVDWWCQTLAGAGMTAITRFEVPTPSMRHGTNGSARYVEEIVVLEAGR